MIAYRYIIFIYQYFSYRYLVYAISKSLIYKKVWFVDYTTNICDTQPKCFVGSKCTHQWKAFCAFSIWQRVMVRWFIAFLFPWRFTFLFYFTTFLLNMLRTGAWLIWCLMWHLLVATFFLLDCKTFELCLLLDVFCIFIS